MTLQTHLYSYSIAVLVSLLWLQLMTVVSWWGVCALLLTVCFISQLLHSFQIYTTKKERTLHEINTKLNALAQSLGPSETSETIVIYGVDGSKKYVVMGPSEPLKSPHQHLAPVHAHAFRKMRSTIGTESISAGRFQFPGQIINFN